MALNYQNITTDDLMRLALEAKCHTRTVRRWVQGLPVHRVTDGALTRAAETLGLEIERPVPEAATS